MDEGPKLMRNQRPRGTITGEAVLGAALAIVDSAGIEGLTIRAVARQVGAPPMSLYSHFANKEELLDLMYGEIVRRMYVDHGQPTWQEELFVLCRHIRAVLLEHPRWTPFLARPLKPVSVPVRERILSLMTDDGMTPEAAFTALSGAMLSTTGLVLTELALTSSQGTSDIQERYARVREWASTTETAPATRAATASRPQIDLDGVFIFTLRALIRGVAAALPVPSSA
jgi:AcrR family transcriptional regulator